MSAPTQQHSSQSPAMSGQNGIMSSLPQHLTSASKPPSSPVTMLHKSHDRGNPLDNVHRASVKPTKLNSPKVNRRRPSSRKPAHKRDISEFSIGTDDGNGTFGEVKAEYASPDVSMKRNKFVSRDEDVESLTQQFGSRRHSITNGSSGVLEESVHSTNSGMKQEGLDQTRSPVARMVAAASQQQGNKSALPPAVKPIQNIDNNNRASQPANMGIRPNTKVENGMRMTNGMNQAKSGGVSSVGRSNNNNNNSRSLDSDSESDDGTWTTQEDANLKQLIDKYGMNWKQVADFMPDRDHEACQDRWNFMQRGTSRKGTWTTEEDKRLVQLVENLPKKNWGDVAALIKGRSAKQCRERWCYNLDPSINKQIWTAEEDQILVKAQNERGNRWAHIASLLPGRTENAVKTRFKSIARAQKREWHASEDQIILEMHQKLGSRWDAIADQLPKRTKNAVKTRYRLLAKGLAAKPPPEGAPNQTLRQAMEISFASPHTMQQQRHGVTGHGMGSAPMAAGGRGQQQQHKNSLATRGGHSDSARQQHPMGGGDQSRALGGHFAQQQMHHPSQAMLMHPPQPRNSNQMGNHFTAPGHFDNILHDILDPLGGNGGDTDTLGANGMGTVLDGNAMSNAGFHPQGGPVPSMGVSNGLHAMYGNHGLPPTKGMGIPSQNRRGSSMTTGFGGSSIEDMLAGAGRGMAGAGPNHVSAMQRGGFHPSSSHYQASAASNRRRMSTFSQFSQGDMGDDATLNMANVSSNGTNGAAAPQVTLDEDLIEFLDAWNHGPLDA